MKKTLALSMLALLLAGQAHARDTELHLPFEDVLNMPEAKDKLDGSVKFYLAGQKTPAITEQLGEDVSNRKTNGFGKADDVACRWAALSALMAFQNKAKSLGANAVYDIVSYYKKNETRSSTTYECHAGAMVAGVALKGRYGKTAN